MRLLNFGISLLLTVEMAYSQAALDNATILKLVKAGIGEDTIMGMVNQQPGKYALSAEDIIALKSAGISEKLIAMMIVRNGANNVAQPTTNLPAMAPMATQPINAAPLIL